MGLQIHFGNLQIQLSKFEKEFFWHLTVHGTIFVNDQGRRHASKVGGSESGEARNEGAKRLRFEGEARIEGEARERAGGGVWGGGSVSPSPEKF